MTARRCRVCSCPLTIFEQADRCVLCAPIDAGAAQSAPEIVATGVASPNAQCGRCGTWVEPGCIRPAGCCDCLADDLVVIGQSGAVL